MLIHSRTGELWVGSTIMLAFILGWVTFLSSCGTSSTVPEKASLEVRDEAGTIPLGLVPRIWPVDNPYNEEKAELGRLLYYDTRLSADNTISCGSCHHPEYGFTDGAPVSTGIRGQEGGRSAPTVINRAYSVEQFWDGRARTLEDQAKGPIENPIEMGNTHEKVVANLKSVNGYREKFRQVFGTEDFNIDHVASAIATFERTIISGNSAFDKFRAGDRNALTEAARRGMDLFFNQVKCNQCHFGINFTDGSFVNIGIGMNRRNPDLGRYLVTKRDSDRGAFKAPTLRDIGRTAPYMHDGSLVSLDEVVEFYDKGGISNEYLDERMVPLNLSDQEKSDLVEFLKSLNGQGWEHAHPPESFPT